MKPIFGLKYDAKICDLDTKHLYIDKCTSKKLTRINCPTIVKIFSDGCKSKLMGIGHNHFGQLGLGDTHVRLGFE